MTMIRRTDITITHVLFALSIVTMFSKSSSSLLNSVNSTSCRTNEGLDGYCKPLQQCEFVKRTMDECKPTVCAYRSFFPVVCCPSNPPPIASIITSQPTPETVRPTTVKKKQLDVTKKPYVTIKPSKKQEVSEKDRPLREDGETRSSFNFRGCGRRKYRLVHETEAAPSRSDERFKRNIHPKFERLQATDRPRIQLIVGGKPSNEGSWPWMAAIYQKINGNLVFKCGGTIINHRYVLTAAHCLHRNRNGGDILVRLGEYTLTDSQDGHEHEVEKIIIHRGYNPPTDYDDIAMLKIKGRIHKSDRVGSICLPSKGEKRKRMKHKMATVIGWGSLEFSGPDSRELREVKIPIQNNSYCNESYSKLSKIQNSYPKGILSNLLCAGFKSGGKDACQGDSGGPLMVENRAGRWMQAGIVSGGFQCARPGFPGIYTRVADYLEWIESQMR